MSTAEQHARTLYHFPVDEWVGHRNSAKAEGVVTGHVTDPLSGELQCEVRWGANDFSTAHPAACLIPLGQA